MKLLTATPNTSASVTARIAAAAWAVVSQAVSGAKGTSDILLRSCGEP